MKEKSEYKDVELMSSKNIGRRRMVYASFIIIFSILTPIIILYTQGYRYNFKRGRVQKTGILIISSIPKKADVYLNNKLVEGDSTPTRIEKLLPADYEIRMSKDGYYDWNKKLQVFENSTTFAEDVILWKNNPPIQLAEYKIIDWLASENKNKIVFITQDREIISFEMNKNEFDKLYQSGIYDNPKIISWSNTNKKVLIRSGETHLIIDTERNGVNFVTITGDYELVKWDLKNDNIVYGLNNLGIWKIDLFTKKEELIFDKYVSDFIIDNNTYDNNVIYKRILHESKNPEILDGINCNNCYFVNRTFPRLLLMDKDEQKLFIIDPENKNQTINSEAKNVSWLSDDTLLFYNDWEIWIYETDKEDPEIITRIGTKIEKVLWHPEGRHVIFTSEIKIIELDNRELRNIIELFTGNSTNDLTIDDKGKNIYFTESVNNGEYIMHLNIK